MFDSGCLIDKLFLPKMTHHQLQVYLVLDLPMVVLGLEGEVSYRLP